MAQLRIRDSKLESTGTGVLYTAVFKALLVGRMTLTLIVWSVQGFTDYMLLKNSHLLMKSVFTACTLLAENLTMQCFTIVRRVNVNYATLHWSVMVQKS